MNIVYGLSEYVLSFQGLDLTGENRFTLLFCKSSRPTPFKYLIICECQPLYAPTWVTRWVDV